MNTRSRFQFSKATPALALALIVAAPPALLAGESRQRAPSQDSGSSPRVVERSSSRSSSSPSAGPSRGSSASSPRSGGEVRSRPSGGSSSSRGGVIRSRPSSSASPDGRTRVEGRGSFGHGGHYSRHYRSHSYYHYPYSSVRWWWSGPYFSVYCPDWWWGGPYGYYDSRGYYDRRYAYGAEDGMGALDIDIAPERAEVYVDGKLIGEADDFDGFPTYLWLPTGTYDVVFYREGFQTLARQYSIYSGVVIDVEDRMEPGTATRPESLASKSTERRDERLRRDRERAAEAEGRREAWRERQPRRGEDTDEDGEAGRAPYDAREAPGRLSLSLEPSDASVYLDGRFLGVASALAEDHDGLIVDAGHHKLEIVRPGYETKVVEFEVTAGDEAKVVAVLDRQ